MSASFADCFSASCAAKLTVAFTVLGLFLLPLGRASIDDFFYSGITSLLPSAYSK